jgi:hypothetical protein
MRGPFFHELALVEKFKENFWSSNFDPFFSSALQPSGKSYCFETHFTFQSGNCTCFYQILRLYLYWFSDGKGLNTALNFSRCSKLFAPTVEDCFRKGIFLFFVVFLSFLAFVLINFKIGPSER